jgi:hypothetical protein
VNATGRHSAAGATLSGVTAKEQVLKEAPEWSEATATAVLRVVEAQSKLEAWFENETPEDVEASEQRGAESSLGVLQRMDVEEEAAGLGWEEFRRK